MYFFLFSDTFAVAYLNIINTINKIFIVLTIFSVLCCFIIHLELIDKILEIFLTHLALIVNI